jgi:hypothetical protein
MKKLWLSICCLTLLFSCGYQTGIIQRADKGYLRFSGSWSSDEVTTKIDGREPFRPNSSDTSTLYEVTPGKHTIKVWRYDRIVVDRVVFLESQATFEVPIP